MQDLIEKFHEENDVEYELVAKVGDEVIARQTSSQSADDLAGYAWFVDDAVERYIMEHYQSEAEYRAEAEAEAQMEQARLDKQK